MTFHLTDKQSKVWWLMKSDTDQAMQEIWRTQLNSAGRVSAAVQVFSHHPTVFLAWGKTNWGTFSVPPRHMWSASQSYTNINCKQTDMPFHHARQCAAAAAPPQLQFQPSTLFASVGGAVYIQFLVFALRSFGFNTSIPLFMHWLADA